MDEPSVPTTPTHPAHPTQPAHPAHPAHPTPPAPLYYAYLVYNLAEHAATRSEIRVHELPHEAMFVRNQMHPASSDCWAVVEMIGPFERGMSEQLAQGWRERTRRPGWLASKGLAIGRRLQREHAKQVLHVTPLPAEAQRQRLRRRHSVYEPARAPLDGLCAGAGPAGHALPVRASQVQLHDVWMGWLRPEAFGPPVPGSSSSGESGDS